MKNIAGRFDMRSGWILLTLVTSLFVYFGPAKAQGDFGIGLNGGLGLFVAGDDSYYGDLGKDIYPELGGHLKLSFIQLGLKVGLIYRNITDTQFYSDGFGTYSFEDEYTRAFLPAQLDLVISPLEALSEKTVISPYGGLMGGVYIPVGDNDEVVPAFSFKLGAELNFGVLVPYGELRYVLADDDGNDAGGFIFLGGFAIRLIF